MGLVAYRNRNACALGILLALTSKQEWGVRWGFNIAMTLVALLGIYPCCSADWRNNVGKMMVRLGIEETFRQGRTDEESAH